MGTERLIEWLSSGSADCYYLAFRKEAKSFPSFSLIQRVTNSYSPHNDTSSSFSYQLGRCSHKIKYYPTSNLPSRWGKVTEAKRRLAQKYYCKDEVYEKVAQSLMDVFSKDRLLSSNS
jgi:hypothetical protein